MPAFYNVITRGDPAVPQLITLDYFHAGLRRYHVYRLQSSSVSELLHYHDYFQVCFVACGEILHTQGGETVRLGHGDAFIIPPGFIHSVNFANSNSDIYSLSFQDDMFDPEFHRSGVSKFLSALRSNALAVQEQPVRMKVVLDDSQRKNVQSLMDCLLREQASGYPAELTSAGSLIASILFTLLQSYYRRPDNQEEYREIASYSSSLTNCIEYIKRHYGESITLSVLARQAAMSRSTFSALFPQFTGLSLKQYIRQVRILEAESLIRLHPELTLYEIAARIGYENFSTFYRNFLRIAGVSPSQYKETYRSGGGAGRLS